MLKLVVLEDDSTIIILLHLMHTSIWITPRNVICIVDVHKVFMFHASQFLPLLPPSVIISNCAVFGRKRLFYLCYWCQNPFLSKTGCQTDCIKFASYLETTTVSFFHLRPVWLECGHRLIVSNKRLIKRKLLIFVLKRQNLLN